MKQATQAALQVDILGVLVVLEAFFRRVVDSRDHTDVVIAAGVALEDLQVIRDGQGLGKSSIHALRPI